MTKLLFSLSCLSAVVSASISCAASPWYLEAGISDVRFHHTNWEGTPRIPLPATLVSSLLPGTPLPDFAPVINIIDQQKRQTAPFLSVGYTVNDWLSIRLSYHFLDTITATASFRALVGGDALVVLPFARVSDDVNLITLAPEFRWNLAPRLALTLSPSLNRVSSHEEIRSIADFLLEERRDTDITFGVSAGIIWSLNPHVSLSASYGYTDLKPSRERTADTLSGALRWHF